MVAPSLLRERGLVLRRRPTSHGVRAHCCCGRLASRPSHHRARCLGGDAPSTGETSSTASSASVGTTSSSSELGARLRPLGGAIDAGRRVEATAIAADLAREGILPGFGGAMCVPKRAYTLEELRLNRIEPARLLAPKEDYLDRVSFWCRAAFLSGLVATQVVWHWNIAFTAYAGFASFFALTFDRVAFDGGIETLVVDTLGGAIDGGRYRTRVGRHEAGHFLIAYLIGVLPSGYTLSAWNALLAGFGGVEPSDASSSSSDDASDASPLRVPRVQAGTSFCDDSFQAEIAQGKLSSGSLDRFCCIALAGVAQEYVDAGKAKGGSNDILQLDALLRGLGFTQAKADDQVRWAVLNVVILLRRHSECVNRLAAAMAEGAPLTTCFEIIEGALAEEE